MWKEFATKKPKEMALVWFTSKEGVTRIGIYEADGWIRINEDDVYCDDEIIEWQYAAPPLNEAHAGRMYTEEQIKDLSMFSWKAAANSFRLYPENKHTFSDFWTSLGEKYSKDFKI